DSDSVSGISNSLYVKWLSAHQVTSSGYQKMSSTTSPQLLSPDHRIREQVWSSCFECDPGAPIAEDLGGSWFLAQSAVMRAIRTLCEQLAKTTFPILILGETGVGKNVIGKLIHRLSPRRDLPLLKLNCAAWAAGPLERELFGYRMRPINQSDITNRGMLQVCHKGTLLLDHVAEMPLEVQARLVPVLQDGEF